MAINFGDTIIEGGIAPSVAVQSPVQDDSGAVLAEALAPAAKTLGSIVGSIFESNQTDNKSILLSKYENELLDLADDVDQGTMTREEAMMRGRVIRRGYLADAPALQNDFDKVWSNTVGANGLGNVITTGTVEEQALEARNTEALKLGYTPQEYDLFQARARQATALNQELEMITASGGIISGTQKNQALQATAGLASAAFPAAQQQINEAMRQIEANPSAKAEIVSNLNNTLGANIAQLQTMVGAAGTDGEYIVTPIQSLLATFNEFANGTIENAVMKGAIENTQNRYAAMVSNHPTLGPLLSRSKLLADYGLENSSLAIALWDTPTMELLKDVLDPEKPAPNFLADTESTARFAENIAKVAETITPSSDPGVIDEVMQSLGAMVDSAYLYERSNRNGAIGYKDIVTALGSPAVANAIKVGGGLKSEHNDKLFEILQQNYDSELTPAIKQFWESVPVVTPTAGERAVPNNIPMNQLLQPIWNGNAVEFMPTPEYANDPRIVRLAADVNTGSSSIGIPLNSLINAYANVSGTDAKTIWENDFAGRLFNLGQGGEPIDVAPKSTVENVTEMLDENEEDGRDDFTLGDFNPDTLEPVAEWTDQGSAITEATQAMLPPIDPAYTDVTGVDYDSYLPSIRASESGGNDSARNPTSTATGRYQFLKSTWNDLVNRYPNTGLTAQGRLDPNQQEVAIRLFTAENARLLQNKGVPLNNGNLYAAHFLGAGDAAKVLRADDSASVSSLVPARVISANSFLRGMSVADFKAWAARKGNA